MFKNWKYSFLITALALTLPLSIFAQDEDNSNHSEESDMEALKRWIQEKRMISIKELGGDLSLSGEVRVEMQANSEKHNGRQFRGSHKQDVKPKVNYDLEVNVMLDYHTDRSWSSIKLEFDNDMGIIKGTGNKINLEKAYFGGRLIAGETFTLDGELGRKPMSNNFDSKVEFNSNFDGALLSFSKAFVAIGDFYTKLGAFLVYDKMNHYGYVGEIGMLHIGHTGTLVKYSLIDWKKHYVNPVKTARFDFIVSQLLLGYQIDAPDTWWHLIKVYAAGLMNHAAKERPITLYKKANLGWYAGVAVGQVKQKGDFALETNYQWVQPQMCPDFDASGIKRGNAEGIGFYTKNFDGSGGPNNRFNAVGGCNYKGWVIEVLYAINNNLTMLNNFQMSKNLYKNIGPDIKWMQYELEFIYAF